MVHNLHTHNVVKFTNLWHLWFQSTEVSLSAIREAVGPYRTHYRCRHVVLPYCVRSQVRTRYFGVSLTLSRPVDENSNLAPIMRCYDVTREQVLALSISSRSSLATHARSWLLHNVIATPKYSMCPIRNKCGLHHLCESLSSVTPFPSSPHAANA